MQGLCSDATPHQNTAISGGSDGIINIWDLAQGKVLHQLKAHKHPCGKVYLLQNLETLIQ